MSEKKKWIILLAISTFVCVYARVQQIEIGWNSTACQQDLSHGAPDAPLPEAVPVGSEPLLIVGAMAGG